MTTCPSCRAPLATGQEYCLECGVRVTGTGYGRALTSNRALRYLATAVVALIGAAVAIAATGGDGLLEIDANPNPLRTLLCGPLNRIDGGTASLDDSPGLGAVNLGAIGEFAA